MNRMKNRSGFTLVELIAVMAILAILLAAAVPQMMGYIKATHRAAARTEIQMVADASQCYLDDMREEEDGKLSVGKVLELMNLDLSDPESVLKDYIRAGQKDARIVRVVVDMDSGRLEEIEYQTKYSKVTMTIDAEGNRTLDGAGSP